MTEDDAGRKARRKAVAKPLPTSSHSYDGLLTYLGVRLYEERNRRRKAAEEERDATGDADR